jgi:hypothetical protein
MAQGQAATASVLLMAAVQMAASQVETVPVLVLTETASPYNDDTINSCDVAEF